MLVKCFLALACLFTVAWLSSSNLYAQKTAPAAPPLAGSGPTRDLRIEKVRNVENDRSLSHAKSAVDIAHLPIVSKRWALVIGIDTYEDKQIAPLFAASNDAAAIAESFTQYAGFPKDQVVLLASNQPGERQPTRGNILLRLANMARMVPKDGVLLFSFAGHGIERNGEAFLLPSDAKMSDNIRVLQSTALSVNEVKEWIKEMGVKQVLVLLDACRNDPLAGRSASPNPMTESLRKGFDFETRNSSVEAFATLYATRVGQRAYEYSEKRHGYFTWGIIEGLKGRAANENGEITLGGLEKYIQEVVPRQIGIDLGADKEQRPFADVRGYRASELVLAKVNPLEARAAEFGPPPPDPRLAQLEEWEKVRNSSDVAPLQAYLQRYPNSSFRPDAQQRIQMLEWEAIKSSNDAAGFRAFLERHPAGNLSEQAKAGLERITRQEANRSAIENTLQLYRDSYERRDGERLKSVWPSLGRRDLARVEEFFKMARAVSLQLVPASPVAIDGDSAQVVCRRTLQFSDERGSQPANQDTITIRLKNAGPNWVIESVK